MTKQQDKYLESIKNYGSGKLFTYLTFNGDTTGLIQLIYRDNFKTISETKKFRVSFEGEYTLEYPMLGTAEYECLINISNKLK